MAELVRVSGAHTEPTNEETSSSTGKLIADLVEHWEAVGTVLRLPDHAPLPCHSLVKQATLPSTLDTKTIDIHSRLSE